MGEWIRHRGSKTMPKRLEGMQFEARLRNGYTIEGKYILVWEQNMQPWNVMAYRIIGKIEPKPWPEDRIDAIGQNGNTGEHYSFKPLAGAEIVTCSQPKYIHELQWQEHGAAQTNKYQRTIKGVTVDVYDVLVAFNVTCPAMAHAIKKMLMPGQRGSKDAEQDKREAIQSIERSIELMKGGE